MTAAADIFSCFKRLALLTKKFHVVKITHFLDSSGQSQCYLWRLEGIVRHQ